MKLSAKEYAQSKKELEAYDAKLSREYQRIKSKLTGKSLAEILPCNNTATTPTTDEGA